MTIESVTSSLEERGILWQGAGFAMLGVISLLLLWIYSEADHWTIGIYRLAVTQLSWAFVVAIAIIIEGIRKMFETRTEIRRAAREKVEKEAREKGLREGLEEGLREGLEEGLREGLEEGERRTLDRIRSKLQRHGVVLPPEAEEDIFNHSNGSEA